MFVFVDDFSVWLSFFLALLKDIEVSHASQSRNMSLKCTSLTAKLLKNLKQIRSCKAWTETIWIWILESGLYDLVYCIVCYQQKNLETYPECHDLHATLERVLCKCLLSLPLCHPTEQFASAYVFCCLFGKLSWTQDALEDFLTKIKRVQTLNPKFSEKLKTYWSL